MPEREQPFVPTPATKHVRSAAEEARLAEEWAKLTPAERDARDRLMLLTFLGGLQLFADHKLVSMNGRDCPMVHGGPGREREVVAGSAIDFYRGIKEDCAEMALGVRNNDPLPWQR